MNYQDYTFHDLVEDARFRQWVLDPATEEGERWENFPDEYPAKVADFRAAQEFILALGERVESRFPTSETEQEVLAKLRQEMQSPRRTSKFGTAAWLRFAAAASVVLILALGYYFQKSLGDGGDESISYEDLRQRTEATLVERSNPTAEPLLVKLTDGSLVFLKPGSRISYDPAFDAGKIREVYLSGEAYFEVAKNPKKPFYVYANELVTKVLGTSFNVRAYSDDQNVTVKVNSGKVAVAVAREFSKKEGLGKRELEGILLLPNQQAVLSRKDIRLVKELVENPVQLPGETGAPAPNAFRFKNARVSDIFRAIEKAYGVDMVFDADLFDRCLFNGDLTDESLFQKLDVVCLSIEAQYQMLDAQIIISGEGCQP